MLILIHVGLSERVKNPNIKKCVCPSCQKLRALMSTLASSLKFASSCSCSPVSGINALFQHQPIRHSSSLLLCFSSYRASDTRHLLYDNSSHGLHYVFPHGQIDGIRFSCQRYRRLNAFTNTLLFRTKFSDSKGSVVNQLEDPFI